MNSATGRRGLRTFMLVSLGAALFGLVSTVGFPAVGVAVNDPGRVAAQVVVGIGFLGAATIIRDPRGIIGVTTAASVWMMAAIGLAAAAGMYLIAVVATLLTFAILTLARRLEVTHRPTDPRSLGPNEAGTPPETRPPPARPRRKQRESGEP
ncbi:MAG: hypothetical protein KatS3mg060_0477 [Dehalococcoidia bacterium]|nr:MAG: hypothetical protein KatS3mg060_0477 [Dehalococcoidia bacterium]